VALTVSLVASSAHPGTTKGLAAKRTSRMPRSGSVAADVPYMPEVSCHGEAGGGVTRGGV
jgi:hypothetical protein